MNRDDYRKSIRQAYYGSRYGTYAAVLLALLVLVFAGSYLTQLTYKKSGCAAALNSLPNGYAVCCGEKGRLQDCTDRIIPPGSYVYIKANISSGIGSFGKDYQSLCYFTNLDISGGFAAEINKINVSAECAKNPYDIYRKFGNYKIFVSGYAEGPAFLEVYLLRNATNIAEEIKTGRQIFSWKGAV